jgi:hypothetical protein
MAQIMWLLPLPLFFCLHGWLCRVHFDLLVDHRHHLMLLKKKDGKKMQDSVTDIRVAALLLSLCEKICFDVRQTQDFPHSYNVRQKAFSSLAARVI